MDTTKPRFVGFVKLSAGYAPRLYSAIDMGFFCMLMNLCSCTYLVMFCTYVCSRTAWANRGTEHHNHSHDNWKLFHSTYFILGRNKNCAVLPTPQFLIINYAGHKLSKALSSFTCFTWYPNEKILRTSRSATELRKPSYTCTGQKQWQQWHARPNLSVVFIRTSTVGLSLQFEPF
jgi:hypothetical protein